MGEVFVRVLTPVVGKTRGEERMLKGGILRDNEGEVV